MRYNDLHNYTKDLNILYVEDEQDLRKETEDILCCLFKTVVSAKDGEDGFSKYTLHTKDDKNYFDIVLTDVNMPNVDGIELIKSIDEINKSQSIIVMSAYNESNRLITLINLGITNFLHKPFSRKQFSDVLIKCSQYLNLEKKKFN
jgi:YesN/AraC family two-component response regulator